MAAVNFPKSQFEEFRRNQQMDQKAATTNQIDPVYSVMHVNKSMRLTLWIALSVLFFFICNYIFYNLTFTTTSWVTMLLPIILSASTVLFIPMTEEWIYKPWQKTAQKVEHYYWD